jgi:hypothetical protein
MKRPSAFYKTHGIRSITSHSDGHCEALSSLFGPMMDRIWSLDMLLAWTNRPPVGMGPLMDDGGNLPQCDHTVPLDALLASDSVAM